MPQRPEISYITFKALLSSGLWLRVSGQGCQRVADLDHEALTKPLGTS